MKISNNSDAAQAAQCPMCGNAIELGSRGRQRRFCSDACQKQAARSRVSCPEIAPKAPIADSPSQANFRTKLCSKNNDLQRPKIDLRKAGLSWIRVNDVTWKLTDGVMERTPACHGKWPGFNIERGLAWVIEVGWPFDQSAWYARHADQSYGPTSFAVAKQAAVAFVTGAELPEDERARAFTGQLDLNVPPARGDEWIDWPVREDAPPTVVIEEIVS